MAANGVKMEVKDEQEMEDFDMADIDEVGYEDDTGELIFPKKEQSAWLVRVPKDLWEVLAHVDDDEELQIGEVKIWETQDARGQKQETMRLDINPKVSASKRNTTMVPKQYDLTASVGVTKNTFVFSEKNMPGYKPKGQTGNNVNGSQDLLGTVDARESPVKVGRRRGPRTIPKRTEYFAAIHRELVCTPRDTAEYRKIEAAKNREGLLKKTPFVADETEAKALQRIVMQQLNDVDGSFVRSAATKKRPQDNKATRMDATQLLDALYQLFREYKYWPMSGLKARLKQPEAWLKENLAKIAILVKNGTAANHYMLQEAQVMMDDGPEVKAEEIAPEVKNEGEDDDDDVDFEDV